MSPRFLASWYQDDGTTNAMHAGGGRSSALFTNAFTFTEILFMSRILNLVFGIYSYPTNKDGYEIFISSFSYNLFRNTMDPHVIDEMKYKLPAVKTAYDSRAKVKPINSGRYTLKMKETTVPTDKKYLDFFEKNEIKLKFNRKKPNDRKWFLYTETIYTDETQKTVQESRSMVIKSNDIGNFVRFFYGYELEC